MSRDQEARIYVGNLPQDVRQKEIEALFDKYGKILKVELKNGVGRGPPFAFIEFDDYRDAEDAIRAKNGYSFDGLTLRVEAPHGSRGDSRSRGRPSGPRFHDERRGYGGGGGGGGGGSSYRDRFDRDRGRATFTGRRTKYRVLISGLPPSGSWQDLKDHMREAGDVCFADVKNGTGIVEYQNEEDMKYAVRKLDDTEFRSHEGDKAYIRVKEDRGSASRSRSRSPRRRSRSYSPKRRSRSISKSRSRSRSRSPSQ